MGNSSVAHRRHKRAVVSGESTALAGTKLTPYAILISCAWIQNAVIYWVKYIVETLTAPVIGDVFMISFYVVLALISFRVLGKAIKARDFLPVFFFMLTLLITAAVFPQNITIIQQYSYDIFAIYIPFYFLGLSYNRSMNTLNIMYLASVLAIVINWAFVVFCYLTGRVFIEQENMTYSYAVLPHALLTLCYAIDKMNIMRWLIAFAGVFYVLCMGVRGPVLTIVVFAIVFLLYRSRRSKKARVVLVFGGIAALVAVYSSLWEDILLLMRSLIIRLGFSSRVIDSIIGNAGEASSQARMDIYRDAISAIIEKPYFGHGVYGEVLMDGMGTGGAHNVLLQLCIHYGLFIGVLLLIVGLFIVFRALKRSINDKSAFYLLLVMSCFTLIRAVYGATYLSYYAFFLIGLAIGISRTHRTRRVN